MQAGQSEIDDYLAFAERLADAARAETMPRFRAEAAIFNKSASSFDPVTDADREAERALRRLINDNFPDHGVIGEEFGAERLEAPWRWVLDPVDGTRAFICGVASWATLIALEKDGQSVLGVIDQPFTDERWIGAGGMTIHRKSGQERLCQTSSARDLSEARLSTTDPRATGYFTPNEAAAFAKLAERARVSRFSLDAYAYGLLALGEIDLVVEASLKRHDFAALIPAIEGAGGVVTGWRGESLYASERGRIVAAATPELHAAALDVLRDV
ncbi:MAG: histidinol-phosphatase [Parvularculaceae bacterium]